MSDDHRLDLTLTGPEKLLLLEVASQAVAAAAAGLPAPEPRDLAATSDIALGPRLLAHRGAFVTLTAHGRLRGCIGHIEGFQPLIDTVAENGRSAAMKDPRFPPVEVKDLDDIMIEVSALTPLVPVTDPGEIIIGFHGILLARGGRQSVFLPQVAREQGWDLETTLTHLAVKAGLGPDDWRSDTEFKVFEADVF